jgi:hypothetical protein
LTPKQPQSKDFIVRYVWITLRKRRSKKFGSVPVAAIIRYVCNAHVVCSTSLMKGNLIERNVSVAKL